ncbi:MAG: ester cyclase [Chlamydiales bacterium]|nr:ester cyclase [Chlamydiales bacterium]
MKVAYSLFILLLGLPLFASADTDSNVRLIRNIWEVPLSEESVANYENSIAQDVKVHGPHGQEHSGLESVKEFDATFATAFQEINTEIKEILGFDDRVVVCWKWHAAHIGEYEGIPATGNTITIDGIAMFRFDNAGKIVEIWTGWDNLNLCRQIATVTIVPNTI